MTTTPETVEQLAEQIVAEVFKRSASRYSDWTTADIVENIQYKLATFLRSHGIDPATMKPIEPPAPSDYDIRLEGRYFVRYKNPPTAPQPEVVVSERDVDEQIELLESQMELNGHNNRNEPEGSWTYHIDSAAVEAVIAAYRTERAEAERLKVELVKLQRGFDAMVEHECELYYAKTTTQLAATEAKLREAEGRVRELSMSKHIASRHAKRLIAELQYHPQPTNAE